MTQRPTVCSFLRGLLSIVVGLKLDAMRPPQPPLDGGRGVWLR